MAFAFHKGLSEELKIRLQLAGLRIEEIDAQRALAGYPIVKSEAYNWIQGEVERILTVPTNLELAKTWEDAHPEQKPYPPMFAEVVLRLCTSDEEPDTIIEKLKELATQELLFG